MNETLYSALEQISYPIFRWSTSLLRIITDRNDVERMELIGSGTFIKINNIQGILTANHVISLLSDHSYKLGLLLIEGRHRFNFPLQYVTLKDIAIPISEEKGPDLGFIQLPPEIISKITPYKTFFDLSSDRDDLLLKPPSINTGVWFVSGTPDEFTRNVDKFGRPAHVYKPFIWGCEANRTYKEDKYDYIESDLFYDPGINLPMSFGGISGGGLWQVIVETGANHELIPKRYLLSGVAFYQSNIDNNRRFIKSHGRESIYKILFEQLSS